MRHKYTRTFWWATTAATCLVLILALVLVLTWRIAPLWSPTPTTIVEEQQDTVFLSSAERERLKALPVLRMGYVPDWYPLSFYSEKDGALSGVAGDYAMMLARALGVRFELVHAETRLELQQLMLQRKVDIVPLMGPWHDVGRGFIYSEPYLSLPEVFVTRLSHDPATFPDSLIGKTIATAAPDTTQDKLRKAIPGSGVFHVKDAHTGLEMLKEGAVDAYVGNVTVIDALLRGRDEYSLRIAGQTGIVLPLSVAVSDKYAWLVPLVDRMLEATPSASQRQILNSWTAVRYDPTKINWHAVARTLLPAGAAATLVLSFLFMAYLYYRKEALQRRAAEQKLQAVTRHLPAVVFQARKASPNELVFDYVSGNSAEIWGLRAEEMRDDPWKFLQRIDPEDLEAFDQETRRAEATLTPFLLEFRVGRAPGEVRWIRGNAVPSPSETGETVWCGYWVDISDIKQQAAQLQAARDAAEQATASKTHFLAVMSHEIRTPLNGVIGMLELLRRTDMTEQQSSMAATIDESANNLLSLLDEILDLSKIEAGHMELRMQLLDVRGVVDEVAHLFNATASSRGLRLQVHIDASVPLGLVGDPLRLRQVLSNLVNNAIKFTNEGAIGIAVSLVSRQDNAGTATIRFVVTDTGTGISEDVQKQLFMPYAQGAKISGLKASPGGTGLGLSICRRIVEAMGGTITLTNRKTVGAKATLEAQFSFVPRTPPVEAIYSRVHLSIDNPSVAHSLRNYLIALGVGGRIQNDAGDDDVHNDKEPWIAFVYDESSCVINVTRWSGEKKDVIQIDAYPVSWRQVVRAMSSSASQETKGENRHASDIGGVMRVLVAEDHDVSRRLLSSQLESLGCVVTSCEDGQQAWELLTSETSRASYDLLITDGHMPRLDGLSLCLRLRRHGSPDLRDLPILLLSATPLTVPDEASARTLVQLKPAKLPDLFNAIRRLDARSVEDVRTATTTPPGRTRGAGTMVRSYLDQFIDAIVADQEKLQELLTANDVAGLRYWVHRQAGALATMGLPALADQAQTLHERLAEADKGTAIAAVQEFSRNLTDAVNELRISA